MIQRIQSLYLLIAALISGVLILFLKLWTAVDGSDFYVLDAFKTSDYLLRIAAVLFFIVAIMALYNIFLFKNRKLQFVVGRIIILINFFLVGLLVYFSQNLSGEIKISEKGIGLFIPIITILLVVLANKAVKKDEELVKSVDRLR